MENPFKGREPKRLYDFMYDVFSIPRPSGHEEIMAQYVIDFAEKRNLEYYTDDMHNVLIRKNGSVGMENLPPVLLEGHMDMVPIKELDSDHDFLKDPIDLVIDGEWVHGNKTSLGADNGCAVAIMLEILDNDELVHPPIECIFTVQEELGLIGMKKFDLNQIKSRRAIGLDAGSEGVFRKGVSSKYKNTFSIPLNREKICGKIYEITVHGLKGGHASVAFPLDRACAIKLMGRILYKLVTEFNVRINTVDKAVNRGVAEDCRAQITLCNQNVEEVENYLKEEQQNLLDEYAESEPTLTIDFSECYAPDFDALTEKAGKTVASALYLMPFGSNRRVIERSEEMRCYTSAQHVITFQDRMTVSFVVSTDKQRNGIALQNELKALFTLFDAEIVEEAFEFGWDPEKTSPIRDTMRQTYIELFGSEPVINVSHGGNDCMVLKEKIPDFDVVTTAATYPDYHTTSERLNMSSLEKVHLLVCQTLTNLCK